ncbi:hypothetical protein [Muricoccus radiodurans]|uniref:hypothetical protein n=1 Tax=Muricoccus radiodurans TaxID=2231721 RepID=UPI003CEDB227
MSERRYQEPAIAATPDSGEVELVEALARAGIALPPEWLAATAAEYRDLRAKIARLRE